MSSRPDLQLPLVTERLLVREFVDADLDAYHGFAGSALATRFVFWGPNSLEQSRENLSRYIEAQRDLPRTFYELAVMDRRSGGVIGAVSLYLGNPATRLDGELGFVFHPDHWGCGYAGEAAHALVTAAFTNLGLHRICATCDRRNTASARVLEKLGMRREGTHLASRSTEDGWVDELSYGVLAAEFSERSARTRI